MPLRSDWTGERCPIARSLEVLGPLGHVGAAAGVFWGTAIRAVP
jgi:hypothetical protein